MPPWDCITTLQSHISGKIKGIKWFRPGIWEYAPKWPFPPHDDVPFSQRNMAIHGHGTGLIIAFGHLPQE